MYPDVYPVFMISRVFILVFIGDPAGPGSAWISLLDPENPGAGCPGLASGVVPSTESGVVYQLLGAGPGAVRCTPPLGPVAGAQSLRFWVTRLCHRCGGTHILTYP